MNQENNRRYYFAYGSNLNLYQMKHHCRQSKVVGSSYLSNYRLSFNGTKKGHSFLTIEECEGAMVPIGIYLITPSDEKRLDIYEGYPTLYSKKEINIPFNDTTIKGLIYVMHKEYTPNIPDFIYYEICTQGYRDFSFDKQVLDDSLKRTYELILQNKSKKKEPKKSC